MNLEKASVRLAYMLRHSRAPLYVSLDGGWACTEWILEELKGDFPWMNRESLDKIVAMDKKGRYSYSDSGRLIRANQGHSIPGVKIRMAQPEPPELLYHGTAERFLPAIEAEGLRPMNRQFVHISASYETAVTVGSRHGTPVVLAVRAAQMARDGYALYLSDNGVWQTKEVPPQYFYRYSPKK